MRIIFFGTPTFAATILDFLLTQGVEVAAIVTRPDKPRGRSGKLRFSPVKELALEKEIPLFQPQKASSAEFEKTLKELNADLFVVAAYAEILRENILEIPPLGCINVHGSVLPKYRGAAPVERCIMEGEKESGVTIMKMVLQLDAGDILSIAKTPIPEEMTAGELRETLAHLGKQELLKVMEQLEKGTAKSVAQDDDQASYAAKLKKSDGFIDWNRPNTTIFNHIRGVTPKPGAWCWVKVKGAQKRLMIKKSQKSTLCGSAGEILSQSPSELIIGCETGAVELVQVQLEGKKTMSARDFLRGNPLENLLF